MSTESGIEKREPMLTIYVEINRGLGHSADPQEIDDLEQFLERVLPPVADKEQKT